MSKFGQYLGDLFGSSNDNLNSKFKSIKKSRKIILLHTHNNPLIYS
jgi:hypothetical protein